MPTSCSRRRWPRRRPGSTACSTRCGRRPSPSPRRRPPTCRRRSTRRARDFKLESWDWRYYAEKVKKARFDLDEQPVAAVLPARPGARGRLRLVGNRLYGITLTERKDVPVYHPEVKAFEVKEKDGTHIGIFYVDYHPRAGKRGGAWSTAYRRQWIRPDGTFVAPVVSNVGNFSRPTGDTPALLSLDEVETLFHEFGHALHQLLSRCRYRGQSGRACRGTSSSCPRRSWRTGPTSPRS